MIFKNLDNDSLDNLAKVKSAELLSNYNKSCDTDQIDYFIERKINSINSIKNSEKSSNLNEKRGRNEGKRRNH